MAALVLLQQVRLAPTSAPACPLCPQCTQTLLDHQLCLLCDGDDPSFCYDCATITTNFKYYSTSGYYADSEGVCQLVREPAVGAVGGRPGAWAKAKAQPSQHQPSWACRTMPSTPRNLGAPGHARHEPAACRRPTRPPPSVQCPNTGFELSSDFVGQQPCIECANLNGTCTGCIDG